MKPRHYQEEAAEDLYQDVIKDPNCHPVGILPTATGKSLIICLLIDKIISGNPKAKVLVLAHDSRILEQDYDKLVDYFHSGIAMYSSHFNMREISMVTVAGIQSVYRRAKQFEHFDYVIIDEAHMINTEQKGMYRNFLAKIKANYIGLTATAFRTGYGMIDQGKTALFNKISYDASTPTAFQYFIDNGYLSPLYAKGTKMRLNPDGVSILGGDYQTNELSKKFDIDPINFACVAEIIAFGEKYKRWLVFAIDTEHCDHVAAIFNSEGISAISIHSKHKDVDQRILDYKAGKYRVAINVNMLTVGFDFPEIDLIGMLRSSASPVFHVQTGGRGMRVSEGKTHCLFLDFAGNTKRMGPIDNIQIKQKSDIKKEGVAIIKECPECQILLYASVKECHNCGHVFEFKSKLQETADSDTAIMSKEIEYEKIWFDVKQVTYGIISRKGKPSYMKVSYFCGLQTFSEPVCINFKGWAGDKAKSWIMYRLKFSANMPKDLQELYKRANELRKPQKIFLEIGGKYPKFIDFEF